MKDLVLLHGALGSSKELEKVKNILSADFNVYTFDFNGHGNEEATNFYIDGFSNDLKAFITKYELDQPFVFGYSMGGYVALYHETKYPGSIGSLLTLGTKFDWNPESSSREAGFLVPELILIKAPHYAEYLSEIHGIDWKENMRLTKELMLRLGDQPVLNEQSLKIVEIPVTIARGSNDRMVSPDESQWASNLINSANYYEIPEFDHPLNKLDDAKLAKMILDHFYHVLRH